MLFILTSDRIIAVEHQSGMRVEEVLPTTPRVLDLIPTATGAATLAVTNTNTTGRPGRVIEPKFQVTNWKFEASPTAPLTIATGSNQVVGSSNGIVVAGKGTMRALQEAESVWMLSGRGLADDRASFYYAFPFHAFSDTDRLVVDRMKLLADGNTRRVTEIYSTGDGALVETHGQIVNISRDRRFAVIAEPLTDRSSSLHLFSVGEAEKLFDLGEHNVGVRYLPTSFHMTSGIRAVFSPDSKTVAVCNLTGGQTTFWSIPDRKQLADIETPGGTWDALLDDRSNMALARIGHDDETYEQSLFDLVGGTTVRKWESAKVGLHWRGFLGNRLVGFAGKSPRRHVEPHGTLSVFESGDGEQWELGATQWNWNTGENIGSSVELLPKIRVNREQTRLFVIGTTQQGAAAELWDLSERRQLMSWKPDGDPMAPAIAQAIQRSPLIDTGPAIHVLLPGNSWRWSSGDPLQEASPAGLVYDQRDASVRLSRNQNPRWILMRGDGGYELLTGAFDRVVSLDSGVSDSILTGYVHPAQDRLNVTGDRFVATAGLYDAASGQQLSSFPGNHSFRSFDSSGRWLLTVDRQISEVRIWNAVTGDLAHKFSPAWDDRWASILDGMSVDITGTRVTVQTHGTIVLWDAERNLEVLAIDKPHHLHSLAGLARSRSGKLVVSGDGEGTLQFRDGETGASLRTVLAHLGAVSHVDVSDDGQLIASVGADGMFRLWNDQAKPIATRKSGEGSTPAEQLLIVSGGKQVCGATTNGELSVLDLETGESRLLSGDHSSRVTSLARSDAGPYVAAGFADGAVQIWNIETSELFKEWSSGGTVTALVFAGANALIVGGRQAVLWDIAESRTLWTIDVGKEPVTQLAITNENKLAVATKDNVKLFDLARLQQRWQELGL